MPSALAIEMKPVESKRISEVGYDADNFQLFIRFKPTKNEPAGALYRYEQVSEEFADDFLQAESLGTFFGKHILKNPDYPYLKIAEPDLGAKTSDIADCQLGTETPTIPDLPPAPEDGDELKLQALEVSNQVRSLSIRSSEEYAAAGNELIRLRAMKKAAKERLERIKRPAYETYRAALELEKDVMRPYGQAEDFLDSGMALYRQREKRERERVEAELTRERQEAAAADAKARAKELAEQDAKTAEAQGQSAEIVEQIRQRPLPLAPLPVAGIVLPREVPKIKGIIERAPAWKWRVKPGEELLVPREYLCIDDAVVNGVVKSLKGKTNIPGIEVYEEEAKVGVRA